MNAANEGGGFGREDRVLALQTSAATLASVVQTTGGRISAQEILPIAGDLLRRSQAVSADLGVVDQALSALSPTEVSNYLGSLDVGDLSAQLSRAAEEAMEAGLAESRDEQELWSQSATDALFARDRAESVKVALERWARLRGGQAVDGASLLSRRLGELDRAFAGKARTMTALNARRRTERDLLDADHRPSAWWFTSRSECDDLLRMLSGEAKAEGAHLSGCADCQRDLERARPVETPPERHITSEEAWQMELGELPRAEKRRLEAHAEGCLQCGQLLWAMAEGDKAIDELEGGAGPAAVPFHGAASSPGAATRPPMRAHREVARREAYRVVAIRGPRMRVLVQPQPGRGVAMAVMSIPPQRNIFEPTPTQEGLEFDLGETKDVEGRTARLTVRVTEGGDNEVLDVTL